MSLVEDLREFKVGVDNLDPREENDVVPKSRGRGWVGSGMRASGSSCERKRNTKPTKCAASIVTVIKIPICIRDHISIQWLRVSPSLRLTFRSGPLLDASHPRMHVYTKKARKLIPAHTYQISRQPTESCGDHEDEDEPVGSPTKIDRD